MTRKTKNVEGSENTRQSNIELFRIVTMLTIVAHHFVVNSGLMAEDGPIYEAPFSWRSIFLLIFGGWGKIGINCFVLITGYFMCTSSITVRKFVKILFEYMFYSITISSIFWITGYEPFSILTLIKVLIPIRMIGTDFVNAFIVFFLFIPFLNILIRHIDEKQHVLLLLWCSFTYIFMGSVPIVLSVTMNYVSWFSVLYIIASYIRLYPKKIYTNKRLWLYTLSGFILIDSISIIVCTQLGVLMNKNISYVFVTDSNVFLAVATGVSAFMLFRNIELKNNKIINKIAASTFGVLLIHANSDTMRQWLWKDVFDNVGHYNSSLIPLYAIGSVLIIYITCSIIDFLRIRFIEKPFFALWDNHWDHIDNIIRKKESKFFYNLNIRE